jgi:hypothetical protein
MSDRYDAWLVEVCLRLTHPAALNGTSEAVLRLWCRYGAHPRRAANILNERWQAQARKLARQMKSEVAA